MLQDVEDEEEGGPEGQSGQLVQRRFQKEAPAACEKVETPDRFNFQIHQAFVLGRLAECKQLISVSPPRPAPHLLRSCSRAAARPSASTRC